jgi:glycosyltransferase involved in cell wall biosynthesis
MSAAIFLNMDGQGRGGPQVWSGRFRRILEQRGYPVTLDLNANWAAALFITGSEGMEKALGRGRTVGFRVAMGYLPGWFQVMGRPMRPEHHTVNASIARALETADSVFYQSHWARQELEVHVAPRNDRYSILYNGVDLAQFSPRPAGAEAGLPVLGTIGVLRYRFRLETFFQASRRLPFEHRLLVIGSADPECARVLQAAQTDPQLGPRLTYLPYVPQAQLPDLYRQMSLLLHPVCGDVCPNVVIEALACGVPVVAPRYGGAAELVGPGGVIFDCQPWVYDEQFVAAFAQAAHGALQAHPELTRLARRQAESNFDLDRMVDGYLNGLGLPPAPSPANESSPRQPGLIRRLRQAGSRWIARPRFYTAAALRRLDRVSRRLFPPAPNPRPRIAFTLYDFHLGGIENWLYRLALALGDQFEFHFLATRVEEFLPKFQQAGHCAYLPSPQAMAAYLRRRNIDIVQVHNERWPIDAALAAGVPHVIERTDGTRSCTRVPKQGLSLVIASSLGTVPLIARLFPQERITIIYNGIDLQEVDAAPVERPWAPEEFVVGRASRFGRGKNLPLLIAALQRLHERNPRLKLAFLGGDSLMPGAESIEAELRQMAAPLGSAVAFLGIQEQPLPWVKGFDVATCVSNPDNEGIPNSLIEAMACARPVIATRVDQVEELVQDQVNGLLIPPGDLDALCAAIERLMADPAACAALGKAGRATVEARFSLQSAAQAYAAIYHRLLG